MLYCANKPSEACPKSCVFALCSAALVARPTIMFALFAWPCLCSLLCCAGCQAHCNVSIVHAPDVLEAVFALI